MATNCSWVQLKHSMICLYVWSCLKSKSRVNFENCLWGRLRPLASAWPHKQFSKLTLDFDFRPITSSSCGTSWKGASWIECSRWGFLELSSRSTQAEPLSPDEWTLGVHTASDSLPPISLHTWQGSVWKGRFHCTASCIAQVHCLCDWQHPSLFHPLRTCSNYPILASTAYQSKPRTDPTAQSTRCSSPIRSSFSSSVSGIVLGFLYTVLS